MLLEDVWKKAKAVVMVIERESLIKRQMGLKANKHDFDKYSKLNTQSLKCFAFITEAENGKLGRVVRKIFDIDDNVPIRFSTLGSSLVVNDDTNDLSYIVSVNTFTI